MSEYRPPKRGKIFRMERWDVPASKPRLKGGRVPSCDLKPRTVLHRLGKLHYFSQFRRTKCGTPFGEIKQSEEICALFAGTAASFLASFIADTDGWAIVTTPRRRHHSGFHFATAVCQRISDMLHIPFYDEAVQCINRDRLSPEFHLLRPIAERRVILYDDIITTGTTMTATAELFSDREMVLNLISVNNR